MKWVAGAACTGIDSYQQPAAGGTASTMAKSFMKVRQPLLCSLLTHSFLFLFTPHTTPLVFFLVVVAGWHTGVASLQHYFG